MTEHKRNYGQINERNNCLLLLTLAKSRASTPTIGANGVDRKQRATHRAAPLCTWYAVVQRDGVMGFIQERLFKLKNVTVGM